MNRRAFLGLGVLGVGGASLRCSRRASSEPEIPRPAAPSPGAPGPASAPIETPNQPTAQTRESEPVPETVLDEGRSEFNHVVITEVGTLRKMYFVTDDGRRLLQSTFDVERPDALHHEVFQTMVSALLVQPRVRRMSMVGVGGGQLSNYLFRHVRGVEVDVVDICPEVVRLARRWFGIPDHPHYRTHVMDGRVFVERLPPASLDLLVLDAYRGHSIPRHLRTREFLEACARALAPGGAVVANMHRLTPRYPVDRATFAAVFEHVYRFSSADDVQTSVVATMGADAPGPEDLLRNARDLQPGFDIDLLGLASRVRVDEGGWDPTMVPRDDFAPGESLSEAARRHNLSCQPRCQGDGR